MERACIGLTKRSLLNYMEYLDEYSSRGYKTPHTVAHVLSLPYDMLKIANEHTSAISYMALLSICWNHCGCYRHSRCRSKLLSGQHYHRAALRRSC